MTTCPGHGCRCARRPAGAAPVAAVAKCVKTNAYNRPDDYTVQVINNCEKKVRAKVVMRLGRDSGCMTIPPGRIRYYTTNGLGTYKSTVYC